MWSRSAAALFIASTLLLAACGGSDEGGAGTDEGTETAAAERYSICYLSPNSANIMLGYIEKAVAAHGENLAADVTIHDGQLNVQKQVDQVEQCVAQGVDAIIASPMDHDALQPALERAQSEGIKIFGHDWNFAENPDEYGPVTTQVLQGRTNGTEELAQFYAERLEGTGKIAIVEIAFPVPSFIYMIERFEQLLKQEAPGIQVVDKVGNPSDDAVGARKVADDVLTKHTDLDGIMAYNDPTAVGVAQAAQSAGRDVVITGFNGSPDGIKVLEDGLIAATWDAQPLAMGATIVQAAIDILSGKVDEADMPKTLQVLSVRYTKDNLADFVPWEEQLAQMKAGNLESIEISQALLDAER